MPLNHWTNTHEKIHEKKNQDHLEKILCGDLNPGIHDFKVGKPSHCTIMNSHPFKATGTEFIGYQGQ